MTSTPLTAFLRNERCWLNGSGLPKDPDDPNSEPLKAPCNQYGTPLVGWTDDANLLTFDQAIKRLKPPAVRFIGIRSDAAPHVAFLDLDDALNAGGGCVDPIAWYIWQHWPTYTYITPSGTGLRMVWRVEGNAEPLTVKTTVNKETKLSEAAFSAGVFNDKTGEVEQHTFNIGRELYYRAVRFLIVTSKPYTFQVDGVPDPLATITPAQLKQIAALVKLKHAPIEQDEIEFMNSHTLPYLAQREASEVAGRDTTEQRVLQVDTTTTADRDVIENRQVTGQGETIIARYNRENSISSLLGKYGYKQARPGFYTRPGKNGGVSVQVDADGKAYSYSSNDPMQGAATDAAGKTHRFDAFDVFVTYEHKGDRETALRALCIEYGMDEAPVTNPNSPIAWFNAHVMLAEIQSHYNAADTHNDKGYKVRPFDILLKYQYAGDMKAAIADIRLRMVAK